MRTGFCKHFRAMGEHKTCSAGVTYETLGGNLSMLWPCFFKGEPPTDKSPLCSLALYPTAEERAAEEAEEAEDKRRFDGFVRARAAIVKACGGPWRRGYPSQGGVIDCPACLGALRYSRAGVNGHIHARCETVGCVAWME